MEFFRVEFIACVKRFVQGFVSEQHYRSEEKLENKSSFKG